MPAAKSYAGPGTAPHAWGSKENTVNWNAPLAWVAWYIENKIVPNLGGCGGNCPPQASSMTVDVQMDEAEEITLSANDYDGSVTTWTIVQQPSLGSLSGTAPDLTYTPNPSATGVDTFTFRVEDDNGSVSADAVVTLKVRDCDMIEIFDVPRSTSYPTNSRSEYAHVHVSENGPNLNDVTKHVIQWTGDTLHEFSLSTNNSPYYLDLKTCMTQTLSQSNPSLLCQDAVTITLMANIGSTNLETMKFGCRRKTFGLLFFQMILLRQSSVPRTLLPLLQLLLPSHRHLPQLSLRCQLQHLRTSLVLLPPTLLFLHQLLLL
jgi:hypothetical protein